MFSFYRYEHGNPNYLLAGEWNQKLINTILKWNIRDVIMDKFTAMARRHE